MYKTILIICFSLFIFTGCKTTNPVNKAWTRPEKPVLVQPKFEKEGDRLYLDKENAILLRNNIVELKSYQEKLEFLLEEVLDYYTK